MATSGGMGSGLAGDRASENYSPAQPIWQGSQPDQSKQQVIPQKQPRMNLTKEEMQALQECSRESFYYRCIPLGFLFMGGTQILVKKGMLRPHPRLGALPKSMFAGLVAYIAGKVSYQGECRRKIMALPNSPLGDAMRQGKKGRDLMEEMSFAALGGGQGEADQAGAADEPVQQRLSESYVDTQQGSGLDDNMRPSVDSMAEPAPQEKAKSYVTYDELRKRNRTEHEQKLSPSNTSPLYEKPPPRPQYQSPTPTPRVRTNQYGDVIEE